MFIVAEVSNGGRRGPIGLPHQHPRNREYDVPRILRLTERLPASVLGGRENLRKVPRLIYLREALQAEHCWLSTSDEGAIGRCRDCRHRFQRCNVLFVGSELEVPDEDAVRISSAHAECLFIDLLEERALVEFGRSG